jgi:C-terminal processing protease CtpA/Prc
VLAASRSSPRPSDGRKRENGPVNFRSEQTVNVRRVEFKHGRFSQPKEFSDLGIYFTMENGLIKVVTPIDEMPAAKAGIMAEDIIIELDDEQVQGLTLKQATEKMRGSVDTKIKLTIIRKGHDAQQNRLRHSEPKRLGGLKVHDHLELSRKLNG